MKLSWRLLSGLVALSLVIVAVAWTLPQGSIPTAGAGTAARSAGGGASAGSVQDQQPPQLEVYVSEPSAPTISTAVRDLPPLDPGYLRLDREGARKDDFGFIGPDVQGPLWLDPLVELQQNVKSPGPDAFTTPLANWAGMDYNIFPPDTTGDVGPNHVVQAVNGSGGSTVQIWDKSGTVLKTFTMDSLSSTAPCNDGFCDPIVIYDGLADRWLITEFSTRSTYAACIYVSTTPDPTGTWYAYTFDLDYYDYPKYAVWPDAYYMGYNGGATGYRQVFAFDRAKMLAGQSATYQMFSVPSLPGFGFQLVVPASVEGPTPPPAGAPGLFMRPRDTEVHDSPTFTPTDLMEMWAFHVDWVTPGNSTLTKLADVEIADYDCSLCGTSGNWDCMPQPDSTQAIDPIREPLHQPLQYRNWGTYETLVGGFAEDVDGTDKAAVRWFELRRTGGVWSAYQEGVVGGGDSLHRSVTSVAMDGAGGIALGYTRTGSSVPYYPSILYAGRRSWDPLGTMPYFDIVAQAGNSSQATYDRWGDYSGIGVDPADDCTFWYTTEYMSGGSSATRVISLRFDADFYPDATPNTLDVCVPADAVYTVTPARTCAFSGVVTMSVSGLPNGATASWSANPVTPPGSTTLTIGNTGSAALGAYNITISGVSGSLTRQETVVLNLLSSEPLGAVTLSSPANGATGVVVAPSLTWSAVSGASSYDIEVATDPDFLDVVAQAAGLTGTSWTPSPSLNPNTVYYWRVTANNTCGAGSYSATWAFQTMAPPACITYTSTDVPKTISNKATVYSNLHVNDPFSVTDVNVTIGSIVHTNDADLDIYIEHPDNTAVELSTGNGGNGNNYTNTVFDDEAADPITGGTAPFTGSFLPEESLFALDGKTSAGTWMLSVYDSASGPNTGTLNSWSLTLCGVPPSASAVDYSDLASSYGVAWHDGGGALRLGLDWDADDTFALDDDNSSDDGVTFPYGFQAGQDKIVRVSVQGTPDNGWLRLWFDWNNDGVFGDWADGELVYNGAVVNGDNDITVHVQSAAPWYRARLYDSDPAPAGGIEARDPGAYGGATGGEVEDGQGPAPTAVELARFEAWPEGLAIHIEWETVTEIDNLGFNLYRAGAPGGPYAKLNDELIPSQSPGSPLGWVYVWLDATVEAGRTYYYMLEDVDIYGNTTMHGPVQVKAGPVLRARE